MAKLFSAEQIAQAKETSLTELAEYYGYHTKHVGNQLYTLQEHDSLRIYNDRTWYRWSRAGMHGENGGSQIDFLIQFCGVGSVQDAIRTLLEFQGVSADPELPEQQRWEKPLHRAGQKKEIEKAVFILPEPEEGKYRRAYAYLIRTRGLSKKVVDYFIRDLKILYEDKVHHNLVFLGKDKEGTVRYAAKRGTADIYGKKYRGDVAGNDKNYGVNIVNKESTELKVFEASIDLMSYMDVTGDYESNKLVLGMTADNPLLRFLKEYSHINKIGFCLDNDEAGMLAVFGREEGPEAGARLGLLKKYAAQGYETYVDMVPGETGCKDWNEYLLNQKESGRQDEERCWERESESAGNPVFTRRGRNR